MPANTVFLDTNGWFALLNASDVLHPAADSTWKQLGQVGYSVVVTDWVVAETGNGLARTPARRQFAAAVEALQENPKTRFIFISRDLLQRALTMYAKRPDKTWGLVDCASFIVMQDEDINEAFTTDRHFEQAGFKCLLPLA
jgi:predicted nucleic acid-binding protein